MHVGQHRLGGAAGVANIDVRRAAQGVGMHRRFHDVHPATGARHALARPLPRFQIVQYPLAALCHSDASLFSISSFVWAASRSSRRFAAHFSQCARMSVALLNAA